MVQLRDDEKIIVQKEARDAGGVGRTECIKSSSTPQGLKHEFFIADAKGKTIDVPTGDVPETSFAKSLASGPLPSGHSRIQCDPTNFAP